MATHPSVPVPESTTAPQSQHLVRFWISFFICLIVLAILAGLMLAGLFLLMGYKVF